MRLLHTNLFLNVYHILWIAFLHRQFYVAGIYSVFMMQYMQQRRHVVCMLRGENN